MPCILRRCGQLIVLLALAGWLAVSPAEPVPDEELVLQVQLEDQLLGDFLIAYRSGERLLLPLQELAFLFEFPIFLDADGRGAQGYLIDPRRTFLLDLDRNLAELAGRSVAYQTEGILVQADGIYVDSELLSAWFPVDFSLDLRSLSLIATPREPLPVQARDLRARRQGRLATPGTQPPPLTRTVLPYRLFSLPAMDLNAGGGFQSGTGLSGRYSILAGGDLLYMNSELFATGSDSRPVERLRLRLGRIDPDADLLGPLQATVFAFGDVGIPERPLITPSLAGAGFVVSNRALERSADGDRTTLRGDLPPGYEVELYRNNALIDFRAGGDGDRYEFVDVPLVQGLNVLRLVFYGPQGERREQIERIFIGPDRLAAGEFSYRVAAALADDLFQLDNDAPESTGDGLAALTEFEVGLGHGFSLNAAAASLEAGGNRRQYGGLGLRGEFFGVLGQLETTVDQQGRSAWLVGAQSRFGPVDVSLRHRQYGRGFISADNAGDLRTEDDELGDGTPLISRSEARVETRWSGRGWLRAARLGLDAERQQRESGQQELTVRAQTSAQIGRLTLSDRLSYRHSEGGGTIAREALDNRLLLNTSLGRLGLRGELDFGLRPESELRSIKATAGWRLDDSTSLQAEIHRGMDNQAGDHYRFSLSRRFDTLTAGLDTRYAGSDGDFFIGFSVSFGLAPDPLMGRLRLSGTGVARRGAVAALVFHDVDGDGRYGEGDTPLEGVGFSGAAGNSTTDQNGRVLIERLPVARQTDLRLREGTLADPFWRSGIEGHGIITRPGVVPVLEFPVIATGEVDGMVYLTRAAVQQPAANVRLQLIDETGIVTATTASAYDGYFFFEAVPPGRYRLVQDPAQASGLGLTSVTEPSLIIESTGNAVAGLELLLIHRDLPPPSSDLHPGSNR